MMTAPMRKGHLSLPGGCRGAEAGCGSFPQVGLPQQRAGNEASGRVRLSLPATNLRT